MSRVFKLSSTNVFCHTAAILSRETKKALFYRAEPRSQNRGGEAKRGKTKLFWSPGQYLHANIGLKVEALRVCDISD